MIRLSFNIMDETTETIKPKIAIPTNDTCKPYCFPMNPIITGPRSIPEYPRALMKLIMLCTAIPLMCAAKETN